MTENLRLVDQATGIGLQPCCLQFLMALLQNHYQMRVNILVVVMSGGEYPGRLFSNEILNIQPLIFYGIDVVDVRYTIGSYFQ